MKKKIIASSLSALVLIGCNGGGLTANSSSNTSTVTSKATSATTLVTPDGSWVGAYFTNWNQWRNSKVSGEEAGKTKHLDIFDIKAPSFISYSFFAPKVSTDTSTTAGYGGGTIGSGWANQGNGIIGDLDNAYEKDKAEANYAELTKFKTQNSSTLVIASVGGWSYTARFSQFAKDANYDISSVAAKNFLDSSEKLLRGTLTLANGTAYPKFDGLNIDWEYPGYGHNGSVQSSLAKEPAFFAALMKELRKRVDKVKVDTGEVKVLTVALPIVPAKMTGNNAIKWADLKDTFDWIDLMGFDAHGQFDAADSNLMTSIDQAPANELKAAIDYLIGTGVDSRRIVLGDPTYTRQMLVKNKPSATNNYGYGDSKNMGPGAIGLTVYKPMLFTDAPNAEDYYPAGGMVDNTGVYSYNCMLQKQGVLSANYCPAPDTVPTKTDNRGLFGQPLPGKMNFTTISASEKDLGVAHAWAYDEAYNVIKSPAAGNAVAVNVNAKYNGYSVFSYDTPEIVEQKINKLIIPAKLGGMWFWDIHNDAYKSADASKSLYLTAVTKLGTNTGGNNTPTPSPAPTPTPAGALVTPDGTWTGTYFTNWNVWRNSEVSGEALGSVKHLDIFDQKAPSYISYAFFAPKISTDSATTVGYGGGVIGSGWAGQTNGTIGDPDNAYEANIAEKNYTELNAYKAKNSGTLLIASVGGWSYTARFSQFAKDANYNVDSVAAKAFLDSCEKLLRGTLSLPGGAAYPQFDGINIDWEYPGYGHNGTPQTSLVQEPAFFEALVKELRNRVEKIKVDTGKKKVLTVALPIVPVKMTGNNAINWSNLKDTFDWVDLMAFDAHGQFDAADSNLMKAMDQAPAGEVAIAINYLLDSGVDSRRIVLGSPNYTRQMLIVDKPAATNNYGYLGNMNPGRIGLDVYYPMLFTDAPNAEAYYPAGGMVDNTGVYSYNCMLQKQGKLSVNYCPAPKSVPTKTDNRGLFGQPLPSVMYFTEIAGDGKDLGVSHAWAYDVAFNVVKSPAAGNAVTVDVNAKYNGYSVFSYDTPKTVEQKIDKLVNPYKLGGVWFWDIHNDAYKSADASQSLYMAAANKLGTNTQGSGGSSSGDSCTTSVWSSSAVYTLGMKVSYNGKIYQAQWWTQGENPASSSGVAGSGKVWLVMGNCGSTPTPTPTPGSFPKYPNGINSYAAGSKVYGADGKLYECKPWPYSGWCKGTAAAYAPGTGWAWKDAWTLVK